MTGYFRTMPQPIRIEFARLRPLPVYAAAHFPIIELRVRDLGFTRRVGVFYRKDAYLSPAARRFIEILKVTAKEIAAEKP